MKIEAGCYLERSEIAHELARIHGLEVSTEKKIALLSQKYKCLESRTKWKTLHKFFDNPICVKNLYECRTIYGKEYEYFAYGFEKDGLSFNDARKMNLYFYIILSFIREMEGNKLNDYHNINEKTFCDVIKFLHNDTSTKHLEEFLIRNNIVVDCNDTDYDMGLIIGDIVLEQGRGYEIWKKVVLPM